MDVEEELKKLPHRAMVAFAARCAMRVRPLYRVPDAKHQQAVDDAIRFACNYASGNDLSLNGVSDYARRVTAFRIANRVRTAIASATRSDKRILDLDVDTIPAISAALSAELTAQVVGAMSDNDAAAQAAQAAAQATNLATFPEVAQDRDLAQLLTLKPKKIDPSEAGPLGPLWPDGEPDWYRNLANQSLGKRLATFETAPPLMIYFDVAEFDDKEIVDILGDFSDLYHAISGDKLVISKTETLDFSRTLVPEGV